MAVDRTKGRNRRRGEAFWRREVMEQRGSGLSQQEFCRRKGFPKSTFYQWNRRLEGSLPEVEDSQAPEFVAVEIRQEPEGPRAGGDEDFELIFTSGLRLKIPSCVEPGSLARVLKAMEVVGRC